MRTARACWSQRYWVRTRFETAGLMAHTGTVRRDVLWARMVPVYEDHPRSSSLDRVGEEDRVAAVDRLHELIRVGSLSLESFSAILERVLAAVGYADLESAMLALPPPVRLTPVSRRLADPLVLRANGDLKLGSGWQLAADTTISVAFGTAWLDLTAASWDADDINLRLRDPGGRDRAHHPRGRGCADGRGIRTRPAGVVVSASPRRAGPAGLHPRANRGDPNPPPEKAQSRTVDPLEATERCGGQAKLREIDPVPPTGALAHCHMRRRRQAPGCHRSRRS